MEKMTIFVRKALVYIDGRGGSLHFFKLQIVMKQTSIGYRLFATIIKLLRVKRLFTLPDSLLKKKVERMNRRRPFKLPQSKKATFDAETFSHQSKCLKIYPNGKSQTKAVLMLHGGGFITAPMESELKLAIDISVKTSSDVWFPYYPLCVEHSIRVTYDVVYDVYRRMLKVYKADEISFLGISSGAALAIGICLHNNAQQSRLPHPRQIIASSPGSIPITEDEKSAMKRLSQGDIMMDATFMTRIQSWMEHGEDLPLYMLSGVKGDFSNFPITHIYYGSREVLYAEASYFAEAFKKYNACCNIHVGEGLCHCYATTPIFPEGKRAYREILEYLSY